MNYSHSIYKKKKRLIIFPFESKWLFLEAIFELTVFTSIASKYKTILIAVPLLKETANHVIRLLVIPVTGETVTCCYPVA